MMEQKVITLVGGSGFLGRYVVRQLAREGYRLRVISRHPDAALHLKTAGDVGQIVLVKGDLTRPDTIAHQLEPSWAVVNLVGILFESGRQTFSALHAQGAEKLAQIAASAGVSRFLHISALGVDKSGGSAYARTKLLGEKAVQAAFPQATILRPAVIFGPEDNFFNQFARIAAMTHTLPLIGGGNTRLQPVYAADVAQAVSACLSRDDAPGKTYELGGPQMVTLREIYRTILDITGRRAMLVPVPFPVASAMGAVSEILPRPPLTRDQVTLLKYDSIVTPGAHGFSQLGIAPTAMEVIVPDYLSRFRKGGKLAA